MKWNRIICLLIVSVLITGGLTVMAGSEPAKAQTQPEKITFAVNMDRQDALIKLAEGDSDIFMQSLSARLYTNMAQSVKDKLDYWESAGGYNNYYFNRAHEGDGTTPMQNALDNGWIDSPDDVQYVVNNADGNWRFNPFAVQEVRYAMNHFVDRQRYIEDLMDGFGESRYIWSATSSGAYQDYFKQIVEQGDPNPDNQDGFGMSPSGNQEWAKQHIQDGLERVAQEGLAIGDLRSYEESPTDYWQYKTPGGDWVDVEVNGAIRVEDVRQDMGNIFADKLENQAHIKVNRMENTRDRLSPMVFSGTWDNVEWHFYTGGWLASGNVYFPHVALRQMYSPAYGFCLGENTEGHWEYGNTPMGEKINELTYDPFVGQVETAEDYWGSMQETIWAAIRDSVRVYTVTSTNFYAYKKDSINNAVPNAITGWDQVFGPRTLDTDKDQLNIEYFSSQGALYMDNWNWYGGSEGAYGANQRRFVLGYGTWNHPNTGLPIPMLNDWTGNLESDYSYTADGELEPGLTIGSETAVEYNVEEHKWQTVREYYDGNLPGIASKVKYDVNTGPWHHGEEYTIQDIMEYYARTKEMIYEGGDYYYSPYSSQVKPTYDKIKAIEFHPDEQAYTVWGTYTFPNNDQMGSYYSLSPRIAQPVYEAITQEVEDTQYSVQDASFGWAQGEGDYFVHLMGPNQCGMFVETMQNMQDEGYLPKYLDAANMPDSMQDMAGDAETYSQRLQSSIDFFNNNNNLFIANGPYKITDNVIEIKEITVERFDGYTEYFSWDHWFNELSSFYPALQNFDTPTEVEQGNSLDISAEAYIRELFPKDTSYAYELDENDTLKLEITKGDQVVKTLTNDDFTLTKQEGVTMIEASTPTGDLEADQDYGLQLSLGVAGATQEASATGTVYILEGATSDIQVSDLSVDPSSGEPPLEVDITASATNDGEAAGTLELMVGGESKATYNLDAGESVDVSETHTFEDYGTHDVTLGDQTVTVNVGNVTTYTLTIDTEGEGSVSVNPDKQEYEEGEDVTLTAEPADGWQVQEWTGDVSETDATIEITMDDDKSVTAVFNETEDDGGNGGENGGGNGDDDDGTPGFTLGLFVIGAVVAVFIYQKKKR